MPDELAAYKRWKRRQTGGTPLPPVDSTPEPGAEVLTSSSAPGPTVEDYRAWLKSLPGAAPSTAPSVTGTPLAAPRPVRDLVPQFQTPSFASDQLFPEQAQARAARQAEGIRRSQDLAAGYLTSRTSPLFPLEDPGKAFLQALTEEGNAPGPSDFKSLVRRYEERPPEEQNQLAAFNPINALPFGDVRASIGVLGRGVVRSGRLTRNAVPLLRPVEPALAASGSELDMMTERVEALRSQLDAAAEELDFAHANLEAHMAPRGRAPKFGTAARAESDVLARSRVSKNTSVARAKSRLDAAKEAFSETQRQFDEVSGKLDAMLQEPIHEALPASHLVMPGTEVQTAPPIGAMQPGMGIGERPSQGIFGLGGQVEAREPVPLIAPEQVAERERLAAEAQAGQQALPVTSTSSAASLRPVRVPGPLRAEPLGANPPPRPPRELPPGTGEPLPSGRIPGGPRGGPPPVRDPYERVTAALEPEKEPFIDRIRRELPHQFYDRNYALRDLQKRTGVAAYDLTKVVPGSFAAGEDIVRRRYLPLLEGVKEDIPELERLMVLRRMGDVLKLHPGSRLPGGLTGFSDVLNAERQLAVKVGAERFQKIESTAVALWAQNDEQVLRPLLNEGILSKEQYLALNTSHPHYIPFQRADFLDIVDRSFRSRGEANLSATGIKTLTQEGSERVLDKPLQRLVTEPVKAQGLIFRNRAARSIVEALETLQSRTGAPLLEYIEPKAAMRLTERVTGETLPRAFKGEHSAVRDTLSFYKNGVKHTVEMPALFAQIGKGMEAEPNNILVDMFRILGAPLRKGAVELNPLFTPTNIIRDAMSAIFREKVVPFGPDYIAGLVSAIRKDKLFSEAAQEGAFISGIVDTMKAPKVLPHPPLGRITLSSVSDAALLLPRLLVAIPRTISGVNVVAERGVRLGTYRQLRRQGLSTLEAAVRARDVTVDFAQSGTTMRVINQVIPFANAGLQGGALMVKTVVEHPVRSAAFMAFAAAFASMERLNNMRFDTSEDIPDYEYTRSWIFQLGTGTRKDRTRFPIYIRVPKGEIVGAATFPVEAMFNAARKTEDRSAAELLLKAGLEQGKILSPVSPQLLPPVPIIQSVAGLATGVDPYTGSSIVPRREVNLLPEQQYGPGTSAVAVEVGRASGVSPRMIDFAIKDYLAGGGTTSNWLISAGLEVAGWKRPVQYGEAFKEPPPKGVEAASQTPIGRFLGTKATQQERRGWDVFNKVVETTNREFRAIPEMDRLGIRLGEVGATVGKVELTPQQRVAYQTEYARRAIPRVRGLELFSTDEYKRKRVRAALDEEREKAARQALSGLNIPFSGNSSLGFIRP